jgi:hypothetical protein
LALPSPNQKEEDKDTSLEEKIKALENIQAKNADLLRRIQKHLEL